MLRVKVFTIFPELFPGPLGASIMGRALQEGRWSLDVINIRDYATDRHKTVDDQGFGGGPGMIMRPDVLDGALRAAYGETRPDRLIYMSPRGTTLNQGGAQDLSKVESLGILCGRFEGVDQRVLDYWKFEEVSMGDYVLSGGEIAAYALLDATLRLVPGIMGQEQSLHEESFSNNLLEYPQFTRPREWNDCNVPEILLSGNHELIKQWRLEQSEQLTKLRRPDLWQAYMACKKDC